MSALGESGLERLLRDMQPILCAEAYTFCVVPNQKHIPPLLRVFATVHEEEGITLIAAEDDVRDAGINAVGKWARISLNIHSALAAVGLTAAVSGALAEAGISANVLAGHYHDHIFVPWTRRQEAVDLLLRFSASKKHLTEMKT